MSKVSDFSQIASNEKSFKKVPRLRGQLFERLHSRLPIPRPPLHK